MINKILSKKLKFSLSVFVSFGLLITIACKNNSSVQKDTNDQSNLQTSEIKNRVEIEGALTDETIEKEFVLLVTEKQSPVRIINAVSINEKLDFKKGAKVEIQNISNKAVSSVSLGFAPPILCNQFMMVGDLILNNDEITKINSIKIGEKYSINISAGDAASWLSPQNFRTCPREHRKPMTYIWAVQFADGDTWKKSH